MAVDLATITKADFDALKGTTFMLRVASDRTLAVELIETEALATRPGAQRGSFLVRFRSAEKTAVPQSTYAIEHQTLGAFHPQPLCVVYGYGNVITKSLQDPHLLPGKCIQFRMRSCEHTDHALADAQRNRNLGESIVSAGNVVLILPHIGRIAELAGGADVPYHALLANFQAVSLGVQFAPAYPGKNQLTPQLVVQIDSGFKAAKRGTCDFFDHTVDQLIEI